MDFRLLGQVEVVHDGAPIRLRGRRLRALLAVLLLHANQTVTAEQLIDEVWGGDPPASARQALHYAVHRLRQLLGAGEGGAQVLVTEAGGYRLRVEHGRLDLTRFEDAVGHARSAHAAGDLATAASAYGEALGSWRGPALSGLASEPFAKPVVARLEEERLLVIEERAEVALALGEHGELVGELEALVATHPFRERLCGLLMLALTRSGRRGDALTAFQSLRRRLADGLGIEPGADLRRLEQAILGPDRSDVPGPPATTGGTAGTAAGGPVPDRAPDRGLDPARVTGADPAGVDRSGADRSAPSGVEERRVVTVLAAAAGSPRVPGDPEDERARRASTLAPIIAAVSQYGGTVLSVLGRTVLAVYGVPRARDDDPERAVRTALAICQATVGVVRVGVDTGETIIGARPGDGGAGAALAGGVSGDVLDSASALATAAPPGRVLVGQAAWRATRRRIDYEPAAVEAAGEAAVEAVVEAVVEAAGASGGADDQDGAGARLAVAPRSRAGLALEQTDLERQPPLTERQHELALLTRMLDRVRLTRNPQLVTLFGTPGIGKTRLVNELGRQAERDPELIAWRQGRSLSYGERDDAGPGQVGFWALTEIVSAHAGILDADGPDAVDAKLEQVVAELFDDRDARMVAGHLRRLVRPGPAGESPPDQRAAATAFASFFEAVADERPLVLVFEDLHWADPELLDFVEALPGRVGAVPLLVVCTTRPELASRRPEWGGGNPNAVSVSLGPLSFEGSESLLDALLDAEGVKPPDDATRAAVLARAGGNPLFLEEYVRMLRDRPEAAGGLPIPETVQQLITARVDATGEDRRLLQDLAVLGESAAVGALVALAGDGDEAATGQARAGAAEEIREGLSRLERQELVRRARGVAGQELVYVFRHTLIREVAYRQLLRADRSTRHRRAARWLAHRPDPPVEILAYHYREALALDRADGRPAEDLHEPARLALRAAGDRMFALGAFQLAARRFRDALGLWPEGDGDRPKLLAGLGAALMYAEHGGYDELAEARSAFDAAGDTERVVEIDGHLGTLALLLGEDVEMYVDRVRATQPALTVESAMAHAAGVGHLLYSGRPVEGARAARDLLARADAAGIEPAAGLLEVLLGVATTQLGDPSGEAYARRGLQRLRAVQFPMLPTVAWAVAWNMLWSGRYEPCAEAVAFARELVEPGDVTAAWLDVIDATLAYAAGSWDAPAGIVDHLVGRSPLDLGFVLPWAYGLRGKIRFARGDLDGAVADARASAEAAAQPGHWFQLVLTAVHCRALLARGLRDQAAAAADLILAELRERPVGSTVTPDLAVVLHDLGYPPDTLPDELPPTPTHLAVRAMAAGDAAEAARRYEEIGSLPDAADARLRAATAHAGAGRFQEARDVLAPAIRLWRATSATVHLLEADAVLAGLPTAGGDPQGANPTTGG